MFCAKYRGGGPSIGRFAIVKDVSRQRPSRIDTLAATAGVP